MTLRFWYWLLMLGWALASCWWGWAYDPAGRRYYAGWSALVFLLLFILGLKIFGWPVTGG